MATSCYLNAGTNESRIEQALLGNSLHSRSTLRAHLQQLKIVQANERLAYWLSGYLELLGNIHFRQTRTRQQLQCDDVRVKLFKNIISTGTPVQKLNEDTTMPV